MIILLQPKEPRQVNYRTNKNSIIANHILIRAILKMEEKGKINILLLLFKSS